MKLNAIGGCRGRSCATGVALALIGLASLWPAGAAASAPASGADGMAESGRDISAAELAATEAEIAAFHREHYGSELDSELVAYHARELARLRARNEAIGASWTAGPTGMVRYSEQELAGIPGLRLSEPERRRVAQLETMWHSRESGSARAVQPDPLRGDLPAAFSWHPHGVTGIRDQGSCGSCWDFAACAALESAIRIHGGEILHLSEQQVLSCATPGWGCSGGSASIAWRHFRDHGAVSNACMFYRADDTEPCVEDECERIAAVKSWIDIPGNIEAIKSAVLEYGPVTTGFTVYNDFFGYDSGCYEREGDDPMNHLMAIIGWDDTLCDGQGAWEVKNSWGINWGVNGRAWIKYGSCNIGSYVQQVFYYPATDLEWYATDVDDVSSGDGDGWLDPGETAELVVTIRNGILAEPKMGVSAALSTSSDLITITSAAATGGDLDGHQTGTLDPPFALTLDAGMPVGETVWFYLELGAEGAASVIDSFSLVVGDVPILLVDDDSGSVADPFFRSALDALGLGYRVWDTESFGAPPAEMLARYPLAVWITGIDGSLSQAEQSALLSYTAGGGGLLASGQDIGWFMNDYQGADPGDQAFYENVLKAIYLMDDSGYRHLDGIAGDPIADGLAFDLGGGSGSCAQDYPSAVAPRGGAQPILAYADNWHGALRYDGDYRVVYFAFGLEAINDDAAREQLLQRTVHWLAPEIDGNEAPEVTVLDPDGGELWWAGEEVTIEWSAADDSGLEWASIMLSRDGGETFGETLAERIDPQGSFVWQVAGVTSDQCLIRVEVCDDRGATRSALSSRAFTILGSTVDIGDGGRPPSFTFHPGQPNPFLTATRIALSLPTGEAVSLGIFDLTGRQVRTLHQGRLPAGMHRFDWDGRDNRGRNVDGGVYFVRLDRPTAVHRARLLLLR